MHEELISKKDLLTLMNISYGQLYRWKRKNLIPEEWFIKKSVSTGQETFFPKEKIIERIDTIIELKDDASLDELAEKFSNEIKNIYLRREYIIERNIVSETILNMFDGFAGREENYNEVSLFSLLIYNELILSGLINGDEAKNIVLALKREYGRIEEEMTLIIKRKLGVCFYYLVNEGKEINLDEIAVVIHKINLDRVKESVKKYSLIN
ncbi:YhbD family protein [Clostridium perfringens]|nr:YhbD family protein [Clostridium perfringens]